MKFKLLNKTCCSFTFELENKDVYFSSKKYDVYLNNELLYKDLNTNVFSIFNLKDDQEYEIKIDEDILSVKTLKASYILNAKDFVTSKEDMTLAIQSAIMATPKDGLLVFESGTYKITSLFLKSNITIELKKGAVILMSNKKEDFPLLKGEILSHHNELPLEITTWEGRPLDGMPSLITGYDVENVNITGEGTIDGDAQNGVFWIDVKKMTYARPRMIFLNRCKNINLVGITVKNSPSWTIHPYFSDYLNFYDLKIINPKDAPNTDGLDPESCEYVNIVGINFSVGDDCVALKSGKIEIGRTFKRPCRYVNIRNCFMNEGHGGVVLGSEAGAGVKDLEVERCYFKHTDRGLRIKSRRGRGKDSYFDNIVFNDIKMDNVLTPLVINMFYFCDPDGKSFEVQDKNARPVDETTPYLGSFTFNNIESINSEWALGFFYGLPEQKIGSITIKNSTFTTKKDAGSGRPAMMCDIDDNYSKAGFIFNNVNKVRFENVRIEGQEGEEITLNNVNEFERL